jgi:hypothetical protein
MQDHACHVVTSTQYKLMMLNINHITLDAHFKHCVQIYNYLILTDTFLVRHFYHLRDNQDRKLEVEVGLFVL